MGGSTDRGGHYRGRNHARFGRQRTWRRVRFAVRTRLRAGRTGGAAIGHLHRDHSTADHPLRDGARRLFPVPRRHVRRPQRHPHQLRVSVDRTLPTDALHRCRRSAHWDDQVVLRIGRQAAEFRRIDGRIRVIDSCRVCRHGERFRLCREIGVRVKESRRRRRFRRCGQGAATTPTRHPLPLDRGPDPF